MSHHYRFPLAAALGTALSAAASAGEVQEAWVDRLDGPASLDDYGEAVAVGADGSVYVTGFIFEQVEENLFAPRFMTMRLDPAGTRLWARTYAGTFGSGAAAALHIAIDQAGNVIVSGSTNEGQDWAVVKYDSTGTELWRRVYEAKSPSLTQPDDMALDLSGNVYLAGIVFDFEDPDAGVLVKFTTAGVQQWVRRYYGPSSDGANYRAVAVDDSGNAYAAGSAVVPGRAGELSIVKYDSAGTQQWLATDGSSGAFVFDGAADIAIDREGDIVVAGFFGINSPTGVDLAVAKFDPAGTKLWRRLYAGPAGRDDSAAHVAVDSANNVIAAGHSGVAPNDSAALTLKYDSDGTLLWERRVAGEDVFLDRASAVALDAEDNIYVAGEYDPIGGARFFTVRYDPDGAERWFMDYAGPLGGGSGANDVAVGADRSVCVVGESPGEDTGFDITTIRYEQEVRMPGDVNGDGVVDLFDLLTLLAAWGPCHDCGACPADLNGDCEVGLLDLLTLLANWT